MNYRLGFSLAYCDCHSLFIPSCSLILGSLLVNWKFNQGVEEQTKALLDGFNDVFPLQWLQYFDERELEVRFFSSKVEYLCSVFHSAGSSLLNIYCASIFHLYWFFV